MHCYFAWRPLSPPSKKQGRPLDCTKKKKAQAKLTETAMQEAPPTKEEKELFKSQTLRRKELRQVSDANLPHNVADVQSLGFFTSMWGTPGGAMSVSQCLALDALTALQEDCTKMLASCAYGIDKTRSLARQER